MVKGEANLVDDADYCLDLYVALANRYAFFAGVEPGATPEEEVREYFAGFAAKQTRAVEVYIRHEQRHGAALGDFPGFVQVACRTPRIVLHKTQPGAGEEAAG